MNSENGGYQNLAQQINDTLKSIDSKMDQKLHPNSEEKVIWVGIEDGRLYVSLDNIERRPVLSDKIQIVMDSTGNVKLIRCM